MDGRGSGAMRLAQKCKIERKKKALQYIFNIQVVHLLSRSLHGLEKEKKNNNILTVTALT